MATESFLDQIKAFGARLGLPKVDVDKMVEMHRKNFEALGRTAQVAGEGAKALADKQREIMETAFRETSAMVSEFKPSGNPKELLAKQTEYAKKAFDIAMQNTRDVAELAKKTTSDATTIVRERLRESLTELREGVSRTGGDDAAKKK
jgi:phasin family protein